MPQWLILNGPRILNALGLATVLQWFTPSAVPPPPKPWWEVALTVLGVLATVIGLVCLFRFAKRRLRLR